MTISARRQQPVQHPAWSASFAATAEEHLDDVYAYLVYFTRDRTLAEDLAADTFEKALRQSDLGLNPSNDGNNIRLSFPPLTTERRKEFVKVVKTMAEEGRVAVRNLRRSGRQELESFEKDGDLSEDELARAEKELDRLTQAAEAEIDVAVGHKEQELLED